MIELFLPSPLEEIHLPILTEKKIRVFVKRDDLIHPQISGNKWRKLKHNVLSFRDTKKDSIYTCGGPWSNHLIATATLCQKENIKCHGYVRGEWVREQWSETLLQCDALGMQLHFLSRSEYDLFKRDENFPVPENAWFIPEGGANAEGVKGCTEILAEDDPRWDAVYCAIGTGTTVAGLAISASPETKIFGVCTFKTCDEARSMIRSRIAAYIKDEETVDHLLQRVHIIKSTNRSGFAKASEETKRFRAEFLQQTGIDTDLVYTSKVFETVLDQIRTDQVKNGSQILVLHTGGLQGNLGFQQQIS